MKSIVPLLALLAALSAPGAVAEEKKSPPPAKDSASVEPSEAFRAFVAGLHVTGVYAGSTCAIYVDQKVYRGGAVLDSQMGVRLVGVDPSTRTIMFEDRTGARVSKSY